MESQALVLKKIKKIVTLFLVAVLGGVACHYIIKWLDGDDKDNE